MKSRGGTFVLAGAAALLAGSLYVNALHNPFVYDDHHTVAANPSIEHVTNLRAIVLYDMTRPVVNFSYALDRALWGAGPTGFHATNVLLHMLNVLLLFRLAMLAGNPTVAASAALLFGVHPLLTEAVGYISGRSEVLCAAFLLSAVLCGRRWIRGDGVAWAILTIGFWLASLATKEIGAMFPFALFAYDWFVVGGSTVERRRRIRSVYGPLFLVAVLLGLLRILVLARVEHPGAVTIHWSYGPLALDVVRRYLWLLVYPAGQTIFHSVPAVTGAFAPRALLAFAVVALLAGLAWRLSRVAGVISFGIFWFLLLLVPSAVLTVLDQGEPMAEHRIYAASAGLFLAAGAAIGLLAAWLNEASPGLRLVARTAFTVVVLSLAVQTVLRNRVWSSPIALWRESVDLAPTHYRPRLLLGEALLDAGRPDEAAREFRTAINLRPTEPTGYVKLGGYLATIGEWQAARAQFLEALRVDPPNATARQALGVLDEMEAQRGSHDGRR